VEFDLILRGGFIVDGTGAPVFRADIGIKGDTIAKIGDLSDAKAEKFIDVSGLYVAPGFIDMHNHSDVSIFEVPTADNYILQGVTTIVIGNCGYSPAPITDMNKEMLDELRREHPEVQVTWRSFSEYLEALGKLEKSVNVVPLVGFGAVRSAVLGFGDVQPREGDIKAMRELVEEAMAGGAFGMSTGLIYVPQLYASTAEIIEVARAVGRRGGLYATHMRNEGVGLLDAIIEAYTIGKESGCKVEVSHLKSSGVPAWGLARRAVDLIEALSARFDISADAYPYTATATSLSVVLPKWAREGGAKKIVERLQDPDTVEKIIRDLERVGLFEERYIDWSQIAISWSPSHREAEGKTLDRVAQEWGIDPVRALIRILIDDNASTGAIFHTLNEDDVMYVLRSPVVAIGSDGSVRRFGVGMPHPRNYGTFPRIIARYVREKKLLTLPEAVRKMTSLPARKLGLWDRGIIRPGMKADLVVFNYYTISDTATYQNPHSYPKGVEYVVVNGVVVVEEGKHRGTKPGKLLKRTLYV